MQKWRWIVALPAWVGLLSAGGAAANADEDSTTLLEEFAGILVAGGEWRSPNPDYRNEPAAPSHFALRYRWGPGRRQVIGELVGVFAKSEETPVYWTIYSYLDPLTNALEVLQIGAGGAVAKGRMTMGVDGRRVIDQVFVGTDGSSRSVRHVDTFDESGDRFRSDVMEKDENGNWQKVREWTWMRARNR